MKYKYNLYNIQYKTAFEEDSKNKAIVAFGKISSHSSLVAASNEESAISLLENYLINDPTKKDIHVYVILLDLNLTGIIETIGKTNMKGVLHTETEENEKKFIYIH
jgi:hypothetical protein